MGGDGPLVTDEGHHILDLHLGRIGDPAALAAALNALPGVVEHGLFIGMADAVVVGHADGRTELLRPVRRAGDGRSTSRNDAQPGRVRAGGFDFDLFVIGGGSGGVRAARVAAEAGARVGAGRGVPLRRHLRDPRLRAEEADGLCQRLRRRLRGRRGLRLDAWASRSFDWGALHRRQGRRDRPAGGGLPRHAAPRRGRSSSGRAPTLLDPHRVRLATGAEYARQAHPDRHRRAAVRARHSRRRARASPRTRCSSSRSSRSAC